MNSREYRLADIELKKDIACELQSLRQTIEDFMELMYILLTDYDVIDEDYLPDYMKQPDDSWMNIRKDIIMEERNGQSKAKASR